MKLLSAFFVSLLVFAIPAHSQPSTPPAAKAYGIALEGYDYPYPVKYLELEVQHHAARLAYMDVAAQGRANGRTVLLFHGRNFPSSYFAPLIDALSQAGYRVLAPDQINFGKSSKFDDVPVNFDLIATHMSMLLASLKIERVDVLAHSMGNMAGVRFTRSFAAKVNKLVMYAPVGLEDYRAFVAPVPPERLLEQESSLGAEAYYNQLVNTYGLTLPREQVIPFVEVREAMKSSAEWPRWVASYVSSFYAIWGQPVIHELPLVDKPTLLMVGTRDRTAPGRPLAPPELRDKMGLLVERAKEVAPKMKNARVEVFENVGHLIHLEAKEKFNASVLKFLAE